MTEQEWLRSPKPEPMVTTLSYHLKRARTKDGRRKLRLFGCACCRRVAHLFPDDPWWPLVDLAEKLADGAARQPELYTALGNADPVRREEEADHVWQARQCLYLAVARLCKPAATAALACSWIKIALHWLRADEAAERAVQANLLRCIIGNPFRPPPAIQPAWLAWNGGTVQGLAGSILQDRAFERMPQLGDALEDAGCADAAILAHCRGPGPHKRWCWALDLVLNKTSSPGPEPSIIEPNGTGR